MSVLKGMNFPEPILLFLDGIFEPQNILFDREGSTGFSGVMYFASEVFWSPTLQVLLAGGFKYFLCSPRSLGK